MGGVTARERMSAAGVAAAVSLAREHGLRVDDPVVLHDVFSLRVHLRPAPVVARVPTWVTRLLPRQAARVRHELDVVSHLARQGAPVVAPSSELPAGPHRRDGFVISFWTWAPPDPERPATLYDCAAMLPDLHAALRTYPGELLDFDDDVVALPDLRAAIEHAEHGLSGADLALLHRAADQIVLPPGGHVVLHGDAHPGNMLRSGGELLWIDFEATAVGPREWDLACLHDPEFVRTHLDPDRDRLDACMQLRDLQVALCLAGLDDVFRDTDGWADGLRLCLDAIQQ